MLTPEDHDRFLELIREDPSIGNIQALRRAGVQGSKGDLRRELDDELLREAREARGYGDETIRKEIFRRAIVGVEEPVFGSLGRGQGSGEVGVIRRYSDRLLANMARAYLPEYADSTRLELTGAGGGPVEVEDRSASLAAVARVLAAAGAFDGLDLEPARAEVPEPRALLAAPADV